jgi:hypothetical protein
MTLFFAYADGGQSGIDGMFKWNGGQMFKWNGVQRGTNSTPWQVDGMFKWKITAEV